ncbi:TetR/AcrR family transcriptional regulator [Pseudobacteriovorax antillogorgiicola]|uniref:Transcriptional regulator, TetR family n=1 Tax=Pseudobacteriovorax antillogorgiicola TaxID=1513793 RepID=A0A1Y6CLL1_9BACT|nr:TetR/AcrR family transcriptional regulator [Pseudobacteriovorax antillogorgiicola]TCS45457.1 TetR family transcriptional regulator [Pseudobacteriovorax antillogorgiicola]SMF74724.1 transcriptional regulator, TetR family [Pseudobacteriovorax antillogorgiicola]
MPEQYHHGQLRQAMLQETLNMLARDEAHLIGFRELARRLEVSRAAPYRHFQSIDELFAVVAEEGFTTFVESLEKVQQHSYESSREALASLGQCYVHFALDHPAHYRLMFDQRFYHSDDYPKVKALAKRAFSILRDKAVVMARDDETVDEVELASVAWACVHGLAQLVIDGQLSHIPQVRQFVNRSCRRLAGLPTDHSAQ